MPQELSKGWWKNGYHIVTCQPGTEHFGLFIFLPNMSKYEFQPRLLPFTKRTRLSLRDPPCDLLRTDGQMEPCAITAKVQVLDAGRLSSQDHSQDGPWGCKAEEEEFRMSSGRWLSLIGGDTSGFHSWLLLSNWHWQRSSAPLSSFSLLIWVWGRISEVVIINSTWEMPEVW